MENQIPGRPADSEFPPWTLNYVNGVEGGDLVHSLTAQRDDLIGILARLDGAFRYAPGKWTVNEVLGHVTDTERILGYRTLCVARGEQGSLPAFEQDDYMANVDFNGRSLADITGEFEAVRESSIRLIRSFVPDTWMKRGTVNGHSVTVRGLAFVLTGHEKHHTRILREKYVLA
jgi:DinB family protein